MLKGGSLWNFAMLKLRYGNPIIHIFILLDAIAILNYFAVHCKMVKIKSFQKGLVTLVLSSVLTNAIIARTQATGTADKRSDGQTGIN